MGTMKVAITMDTLNKKILKGLFLMKRFKINVVTFTTIVVNVTTKERS